MPGEPSLDELVASAGCGIPQPGFVVASGPRPPPLKAPRHDPQWNGSPSEVLVRLVVMDVAGDYVRHLADRSALHAQVCDARSEVFRLLPPKARTVWRLDVVGSSAVGGSVVGFVVVNPFHTLGRCTAADQCTRKQLTLFVEPAKYAPTLLGRPLRPGLPFGEDVYREPREIEEQDLGTPRVMFHLSELRPGGALSFVAPCWRSSYFSMAMVRVTDLRKGAERVSWTKIACGDHIVAAASKVESDLLIVRLDKLRLVSDRAPVAIEVTVMLRLPKGSVFKVGVFCGTWGQSIDELQIGVARQINLATPEMRQQMHVVRQGVHSCGPLVDPRYVALRHSMHNNQPYANLAYRRKWPLKGVTRLLDMFDFLDPFQRRVVYAEVLSQPVEAVEAQRLRPYWLVLADGGQLPCFVEPQGFSVDVLRAAAAAEFGRLEPAQAAEFGRLEPARPATRFADVAVSLLPQGFVCYRRSSAKRPRAM
jgi:hypothetical protein